MVETIKRRTSDLTIVVLGVFIALLTFVFFFLTVWLAISAIMPYELQRAELGALGYAVLFGVPLAIFWLIFLPTEMLMMRKGSRKAKITLGVTTFLIVIANICIAISVSMSR